MSRVLKAAVWGAMLGAILLDGVILLALQLGGQVDIAFTNYVIIGIVVISLAMLIAESRWIQVLVYGDSARIIHERYDQLGITNNETPTPTSTSEKHL